MKILIIQLARLGDIYQTWPTLSALRRKYPEAEITLLVRDRFSSATYGLDSVDRIIKFDSKILVAPFLSQRDGSKDSLASLDSLLSEFKKDYDWVINLSFSPLSSYLADELCPAGSKLSGYGRHTDGFLSIPDDPSAYFYAQVGVNKSNRIHLTDLFALVAGVELSHEDFTIPARLLNKDNLSKFDLNETDYVVFQLGASREAKTFSPEIWDKALKYLSTSLSQKIVLVGTAEEKRQLPRWVIENKLEKFVILHDQTDIWDLFSIIKCSSGLVSVDSVSVHISSLTQTPCLNFSIGPVRFWETGPRAKGSLVLRYESKSDFLDADRVSSEINHFILNKPLHSERSYTCVNSSGVLYEGQTSRDEDYRWDLIRSLYMGSSFPPVPDGLTDTSFIRLKELADLGIEQVDKLGSVTGRALDGPVDPIFSSILDQIDDLILQVSHFCPNVKPIVSWFRTEKIRIEPSSFNEIKGLTRKYFKTLYDICEVYALQRTFNQPESIHHREELDWKT